MFGTHPTKKTLEQRSQNIYILIDENGNIEKTKVLSLWLRKKGLSKTPNPYYYINKNLRYKGYKILRASLEVDINE